MNAAKLLRFTAVLTVLAGYVFVFRTGESRIGEQLADNARIAERIAAAERTLASEPALEAERRRLRGTLLSVHLRGARGVNVARFMRDAANVLAAHRTTIATMAVNASPVASTSAVDQLDSVALDVTVEGRYADVLGTIRALSRTDVPASVDIMSLARKNADASEAVLTATLHVVLHRLADVRPRPV